MCKISSNGQEASSSRIIVFKSATESGSLTEKIAEANCQILVYPNPANDLITIEFEKPVLENVELTIEDISGRTILRKTNVKTNKININITTLAKGVYFVHFKNNSVDTKKFIKL